MPTPLSASPSLALAPPAVSAGRPEALAHLGVEVEPTQDRFLVPHATLMRALQAVLPRRGGVALRALAADGAGAWVAPLAVESHEVTLVLAPARLTWCDGTLCVVAGTPDELGVHARRAATHLLVALAQLFGAAAPGAWAWRGGLPPGLRRDGEWMEWTARVHDHAGLPAWVHAPTATALAITITPTGTWFTLAPGGAPAASLGAVLAFLVERLAPLLTGAPLDPDPR